VMAGQPIVVLAKPPRDPKWCHDASRRLFLADSMIKEQRWRQEGCHSSCHPRVIGGIGRTVGRMFKQLHRHSFVCDIHLTRPLQRSTTTHQHAAWWWC
jgi:hypothetical protein